MSNQKYSAKARRYEKPPDWAVFQLYHFMKHIHNHFSAMSSEMLLFLFTECCRINRSAVSDNHMPLFDPWKVILEYFICSHDCHWHYLAFALCGNLESTFFERLYLCQVIFVLQRVPSGNTHMLMPDLT